MTKKLTVGCQYLIFQNFHFVLFLQKPQRQKSKFNHFIFHHFFNLLNLKENKKNYRGAFCQNFKKIVTTGASLSVSRHFDFIMVFNNCI